VDIVSELRSYNINVTIFDPWAKPADVAHEYGIDTITELPEGIEYDSLMLAVAHNEFLNTDWRKYVKENSVIYDVKGCLESHIANARL
jgi:UDP-N-acetyl-D-galactosamine dehydrogenase